MTCHMWSTSRPHDLEKVEVKFDDEDRATILLYSLPRYYKHLVTTLTYGKNDVKADDIATALVGHKQRRKNNLSKNSSGSAFVVMGDHNAEDKKGNRKKRGP